MCYICYIYLSISIPFFCCFDASFAVPTFSPAISSHCERPFWAPSTEGCSGRSRKRLPEPSLVTYPAATQRLPWATDLTGSILVENTKKMCCRRPMVNHSSCTCVPSKSLNQFFGNWVTRSLQTHTDTHTDTHTHTYIYITIHQQKCYLIRQNSDTIACSRHDKMKKTNTLG